jgi:hypothetical protein
MLLRWILLPSLRPIKEANFPYLNGLLTSS